MMDATEDGNASLNIKNGHALILLPDDFAISRLDASAAIPSWARGAFVNISISEREMTVVCPQYYVPFQVPSERDWRCLAFEGPLDFGMTGVIARLASILGSSNVSLFVVSTFDTDYVLVRQSQLNEACASLTAAGYRIKESHERDVAFGRDGQ
jgi:hypothetical protein